MNPFTQFIYNSSAASRSTEATPRSSDSTAGGDSNVFDDWLLLMQELTYAPRGPATIVFEQNETIPEGDWDLNYVTLLGNGIVAGGGAGDAAPGDGGVVVTFPTGTTISNWQFGGIGQGLWVRSTSTAPIMTLTQTETVVLRLNTGYIGSTTAEFFKLVADDDIGTPTLSLDLKGGAVVANEGYEVINSVVDTASTPIVVFSTAGEAVVVEANTVRGEAIYGQLVYHPGANSAIFPSHANLTAAADFSTLAATASLIGFTPTTAADWTDSTPASLATAIDELAARIAVLEP